MLRSRTSDMVPGKIICFWGFQMSLFGALSLTQEFKLSSIVCMKWQKSKDISKPQQIKPKWSALIYPTRGKWKNMSFGILCELTHYVSVCVYFSEE